MAGEGRGFYLAAAAAVGAATIALVYRNHRQSGGGGKGAVVRASMDIGSGEHKLFIARIHADGVIEPLYSEFVPSLAGGCDTIFLFIYCGFAPMFL